MYEFLLLGAFIETFQSSHACAQIE